MHTVRTCCISPGINLTCVSTDKFKTGCLSINLISTLKRSTAASSALLPRVLRRGSSELPDMERISAALDDLYGARIEPTLSKRGELQCIGLYLDFPDERFIPESEHVMEETISLAGGIFLSPAMSGGLFREDYVESEKKNLIDDIRAGINDKRGYSIIRLLEEMCADEAYSVSKLGGESEAQAITAESLTAHYHDLLSKSRIEMLYCGSAEPERVESALRCVLESLPPRNVTYLPETEIILNPPDDSPKRVTEALDVSQGKLAVGFRLGKAMGEIPDYPALTVFNAVYGSGVTSKLFLNVRERLALCYYAGSIIDKHKGIMIVSSGIEFSNFETALNEIQAQLGHIKNGDVSDFEMLSAKRSIATSIKSAMDRPSGLLELYFDSSVSAVPYDPEKLCDMVETITCDDVVEIASEIETDTIYFLTGEAGEDDV